MAPSDREIALRIGVLLSHPRGEQSEFPDALEDGIAFFLDVWEALDEDEPEPVLPERLLNLAVEILVGSQVLVGHANWSLSRHFGRGAGFERYDYKSFESLGFCSVTDSGWRGAEMERSEWLVVK